MSGNCQGILHFSPEVKEKKRFFFQNTDFKYKRQSIFYHFVSPHLTDQMQFNMYVKSTL